MPSSPATGGGSAGEPTILRRIVGAELRRLREARGITREEAGFEIRSSESKISRLELGRVSFKIRDVADLLTLYGVPADDSERERVLELTRQANAPGWWHRYSDLLPQWLQPFVGLERAASLIRTYEAQYVPGLLQTPEYARALMQQGHQRASAEEIDRRVDLRLERQQVLRGESAPTLWAVIDEAALRRPIGTAQVLRAQLEALVEASQQPNIKIQVMPFSSGGHGAMGGSFTILRFSEEDLSSVIYLELLTSALYLDRPQDLDAYGEAMEWLCMEARSPDQTAVFIEVLLKELP